MHNELFLFIPHWLHFVIPLEEPQCRTQPSLRLICSKAFLFYFIFLSEGMLCTRRAVWWTLPAKCPSEGAAGLMFTSPISPKPGRGFPASPTSPAGRGIWSHRQTATASNWYFVCVTQLLPLNSITAWLDYTPWHLFIWAKGARFPAFIFMLLGTTISGDRKFLFQLMSEQRKGRERSRDRGRLVIARQD